MFFFDVVVVVVDVVVVVVVVAIFFFGTSIRFHRSNFCNSNLKSTGEEIRYIFRGLAFDRDVKTISTNSAKQKHLKISTSDQQK